MNFKQQSQVDNFLRHPDNSYRAVLIYGNNLGLIAQYTKDFTKLISSDIYDPFQTSYIEMSALSSDKSLLFAEYNEQSLMGGRKAIIVKDADDSLSKVIPQILESSSENFLILYSTSLKKKSSLVIQAENDSKMISIPCYEDDDSSIYTTVRQKLISEGFTINKEALEVLCSKLSNDRRTNIEEIDKLITYVGTKKDISVQDVLNIVGDITSINMDDFIFSVANGNLPKSLEYYEKILQNGEEPVSIVRSLYYHFYRLLQCKGYIESGMSTDSAIAKLRPPLFYQRKEDFSKQLYKFSAHKILNIITILYNTERDCKTTNMPADKILEYTIMRICKSNNQIKAKS